MQSATLIELILNVYNVQHSIVLLIQYREFPPTLPIVRLFQLVIFENFPVPTYMYFSLSFQPYLIYILHLQLRPRLQFCMHHHISSFVYISSSAYIFSSVYITTSVLTLSMSNTKGYLVTRSGRALCREKFGKSVFSFQLSIVLLIRC